MYDFLLHSLVQLQGNKGAAFGSLSPHTSEPLSPQSLSFNIFGYYR
jgi:hypothetical protein